MKRLTVTCPHCKHDARIDSARVAGKRVRFSCPKCGGKVVVDGRQPSTPQTQETAQVQEAPAAQETPQTQEAPQAQQTPQAQETPAANEAAPAVTDVAPEPAADRRFARIPDDASFPSGIILGEDDEVIEEVRQALATLGSEIERIDSANAARDIILNEQPELCIYVGRKILPPPYEPMAPLTGLPPGFRRRLYLVLVCENLRTLDGNAAFMYEVNMILGKRDLEHLAAALYSGLDYHERLYKPYFAAAEHEGVI